MSLVEQERSDAHLLRTQLQQDGPAVQALQRQLDAALR